MPHINRIRVNNVKYNFGTQFYDDFLMRFSGKNTIYDLANGGGKSVLMLLLLQNLIPNCTLDDKQPIEKLFRTNSGSTTIHSLIEWRLSDVHVKNGFKYMTTGFCARKAKDATLDLEGIEEEQGSVKENASIEYFNYCIFYREFNDNDIKNLPLSNGKERITYNGLKAYLRDLEKKDFNLEIKIFERKNEYQRFISNYGLYESEWEIIRGINKTEGHVRTYFETNYKTARKVVEDLLIEEIIQKSFNNTVEEAGGDVMANTLMEIKDQLIELSKKKADISGFDFQTEALENFIERVESLKAVYAGREDLNESIARSYVTINDLIKLCDKAIEEKEAESVALKEEMDNAVMKAALGEVRKKEEALSGLKAQLEAMLKDRESIETEVENGENELLLKESANDYLDYVYYKKQRDQIKEFIEGTGKNESEVAGELQLLLAAKKVRNDEKLGHLREIYDDEMIKLKSDEDFMAELEEAIKTDSEKKAVSDYVIKNGTAVLDELSSELTRKKSEYELLLTDSVSGKIRELSALLSDKEEVYNENVALILERNIGYERLLMQKDELKKQAAATESKLRENIDKREKLADEKTHINKMMTIYGAKTDDELYDIVEDRVLDNTITLAEDTKLIEKTEKRINNLKNGIYSEESEQLEEVVEYIEKYHTGFVKRGSQYLKEKDKDTVEMLLETVPFLPYSIVVNDRFEAIMSDVRLREMNLDGYFVPVIKAEALEAPRNFVSEDAVFVMASNAIYTSEQAVEKEISKLMDNLDTYTEAKKRHLNAKEVYEEDAKYLRRYYSDVKYAMDGAEAEYDSLKKTERDIEQQIAEKDEEKNRLFAEKEAKEQENSLLGEELAILRKELAGYKEIEVLTEKYNETESKMTLAREDSNKAGKAINDNESKYQAVLTRSENRRKKCTDIKATIESIESVWTKVMSGYYVEGVVGESSLSDDELESKIKGLIEIREKSGADLADKRKLLDNYDIAMEKSLQAIDYKGLFVEDIKAAYEKNELFVTDKEELIKIKNSIRLKKNELKAIKDNCSALQSKTDRTEGAIAEAKEKITSKYGETEVPEMMITSGISPDEYINDMKILENKCRESLKEVEKEIKKLQESKQNRAILLRDLDKIVNSGNIIIEENTKPLDAEVDIEGKIGEITARYDEYVKDNFNRKLEFDKDKNRLIELLVKTGAAPLGEELKYNVSMPSNINETEELTASIKEVIRCIELEKQRIAKSIEEIHKIKDSFENQCIQSCLSIKTQLDRLPKLSKITMEDEVISIISLHIPYIKEELYKERMSKYIDDIVMAADEMTSQNDRLKYIRNQLAWKKLFSVIVTDMNGVRINLYKRERIKEQSRYLPYEEAVGSTGQSQGIYIQFLIAIINYITNINSKDADNKGLRKVIFIDNPFGAAKDVYIWEPIFKLLKVNNVQLVVPARGATPAITGRFDVNYILGQKLVDGRQQTVVVDYNSNVDSDKMDYTKVDFTQVQLF